MGTQLTAEYSELVCEQEKSDELLRSQDELLFAALQHYQGNDRIRFGRRAQVPQRSLESDHVSNNDTDDDDDDDSTFNEFSRGITRRNAPVGTGLVSICPLHNLPSNNH